MKIWYFHHYGTPYEIAGLHRPFQFGSFLKQNGHEVAVFTSSYLHYANENMIVGKEKLLYREYDGVSAVFVRTCGYFNSSVNRVLNMLQFGKRLAGASQWFIKEHWKPDVIIASSPHPFTVMAGQRIAKKLGVPCICEVRDLWPEVFFLGGLMKETSLLGKILLRYERKIYEKADTLLFLKEGDHTYITDHKWDTSNGGKIDMSKCAYVNNGVDLSLFDKRVGDNVFSDEDLESDKFKIVYCGAIRPVNNVGMLLDVAKKLDDNCLFIIYGTGNRLEELRQRVIDENIKNVRFKGYVENKYIPYILSKSSLNILNYSGSTYNWSRGNSSNKLFEYLASGKPVVSTVKMGYDIIERYGCGFSVEECNADNIAEVINKVKTLSEKEYLDMSRAARAAAEHFDISNLAGDYEEIIKQTNIKYEAKGKTKK